MKQFEEFVAALFIIAFAGTIAVFLVACAWAVFHLVKDF